MLQSQTGVAGGGLEEHPVPKPCHEKQNLQPDLASYFKGAPLQGKIFKRKEPSACSARPCWARAAAAHEVSPSPACRPLIHVHILGCRSISPPLAAARAVLLGDPGAESLQELREGLLPHPPCCAQPHGPFQPPQGSQRGCRNHLGLFGGFHPAPAGC